MWYKAFKFQTAAEAKGLWNSSQEELKTLPGNLTTITLEYDKEPYCVFFTESTPTLAMLTVINNHTQKLEAVSLPGHIIQALLNRRKNNVSKAAESGYYEGTIYENHEPTPIDYSQELAEASEDFIESDLEPMLESAYSELSHMLVQTHKPFIRAFKAMKAIEIEAASYAREPHELYMLQLAFQDTMDTLDTQPAYMFTDSGRAMNEAVQDNGITLEHIHTCWIEHDTPVELKTGTRAKAFLTFLPKMLKLQTHYVIVAIDEMLDTFVRLEYDTQAGSWIIPSSCRYGDCKIDTLRNIRQQGLLPLLQEEDRLFPAEGHNMQDPEDSRMIMTCKRCRLEMDYVISFLRTAFKQIHKDYAASSDPEPFPVSSVTYTEKRTVPRHHGKGKPKEKTFTVEKPYVYITYDVSKPDETERTTTAAEATEKRVNWFTLHGKEELIYERRVIKDTVRRYKGDRYRSLIDRVQKHTPLGGTYTEAEEEYTLLQDEEGPIVVGRVRFPNGKYVPMLKPQYKKKLTIKRVVSSEYEQKK